MSKQYDPAAAVGSGIVGKALIRLTACVDWCLWFLQGTGADVPDVLHVVRLTACVEWCLWFLQGTGADVPDVLHVVRLTACVE